MLPLNHYTKFANKIQFIHNNHGWIFLVIQGNKIFVVNYTL